MWCADIGKNEDFTKAKQKTKIIGEKDVIIEDLQKEFVTNCCRGIQIGLIYESRYYLGSSLA